MRTSFVILAGLLLVGCGATAKAADQAKQQRDAENKKAEAAISKLGGTLYPNAPGWMASM